MYISEMMEVHNKLMSMRSDIRGKINQLEPICDGTDIDMASDAIFDVVLNWMEKNIEDIKFNNKVIK